MIDESGSCTPVKNNLERYKLVEEIFDSIAIYLHLVGKADSTALAISNIPFTEEGWKDKLHLIELDPELSDALSSKDFVEVSYNVHNKIMYNLAYILSIRGYEVFICVSKNPGPKNGSYINYSASLKERLTQEKEKHDPRFA
jgi:hypothetical protein